MAAVPVLVIVTVAVNPPPQVVGAYVTLHAVSDGWDGDGLGEDVPPGWATAVYGAEGLLRLPAASRATTWKVYGLPPSRPETMSRGMPFSPS
ncbi:hypothetical protein GCM10027612_27480 [Microbispora bryophytorum subsp. camponoti]